MPDEGGVAQWLEQSAHNRLVPGSNPGAPTICDYFYMLVTIFDMKAYTGFID